MRVKTQQGFLKAVRRGDVDRVMTYLKSDMNKGDALQKIYASTRDMLPFSHEEYGFNALSLAVFNGHKDIAVLLMAHGFSPTTANTEDRHNRTPLAVAAAHKKNDMVDLLLAQTPKLATLHEFDRALSGDNFEAAVKIIPYLDPIDMFYYNENALHIAARRGAGMLITKLVGEYGIDVNSATKNEQDTALHIAAIHKCVGSVNALIECGADTSLTDSRGCTALDYARARDNAAVISALEVVTVSKGITQTTPVGWEKGQTGVVWHTEIFEKGGFSLTHVFNFKTRERYVITQGLKQGSAPQASISSFDSTSAEALDQAYSALQAMAGTDDKEIIKQYAAKGSAAVVQTALPVKKT